MRKRRKFVCSRYSLCLFAVVLASFGLGPKLYVGEERNSGGYLVKGCDDARLILFF